MMVELIVGIFVALAALALILEPLVRPERAYATHGQTSPIDDLDFSDPQESDSPKVQALMALKEIEFDRATGKLSDEDYSSLKSKYSAEALSAIKAEDAAGEAAAEAAQDPAEAAIERARGKAKFCSECGAKLPAVAKFCGECGTKA
jgi:ribosomal protein L40E